MAGDKYGTFVERGDSEVVVHMDEVTAEWLWEALYALGEHVAAGMQIDSMPTDMAERLASLMEQLSSLVHEKGKGA